MRRLVLNSAVLMALAASSGCSSLSGFSGSAEYGCKAPDGVLCSSMEGVYENALRDNLPGQRAAKRGSADAVPSVPADLAQRVPMTSGNPIRRPPRTLRGWIAPYEDEDGDVFDQSLVYMTLDNGAWMIERNKRAIRDEYAPLRALPTVGAIGKAAAPGRGPTPAEQAAATATNSATPFLGTESANTEPSNATFAK